jgi:hypothetical protein
MERASPAIIFAIMAMKNGLTEYWSLRVAARLAVAVVAASMPMLARHSAGLPLLGENWIGHAIVLSCAFLQFSVYFIFISSFVEASLVSYLRMLRFSRILVAASTQDPMLLHFTKHDGEDRIPFFMPLSTNSNLIGWVRMKQATRVFGLNFRNRIEFLFGLTILRIFGALVCILYVSLRPRILEGSVSRLRLAGAYWAGDHDKPDVPIRAGGGVLLRARDCLGQFPLHARHWHGHHPRFRSAPPAAEAAEDGVEQPDEPESVRRRGDRRRRPDDAGVCRPVQKCLPEMSA